MPDVEAARLHVERQEHKDMRCRKIWSRKTGAAAAAALAAVWMAAVPAAAAEKGGVDMSTAYPGITVKAGESVSFPLDFASLDGEGHDVALSVTELPEDWSGYFRGKSSEITKVHVNAPTDTAEAAFCAGVYGDISTAANAIADRNERIAVPSDDKSRAGSGPVSGKS